MNDIGWERDPDDFTVEPRELRRNVLYEDVDGALALGVNDGRKCAGVYLTQDPGLPIGYAQFEQFAECTNQAAAWISVAAHNSGDHLRRQRKGRHIMYQPNYFRVATTALIEQARTVLANLPDDSPAKEQVSRSVDEIEKGLAELTASQRA